MREGSKALTLSISAMTGIRNFASKSLWDINPFTNDTSEALGLPFSVNIVSTRSASDSAPAGKFCMMASNFALLGPSERIRAVIRSWIAS